jgi:hypothetical protein
MHINLFGRGGIVRKLKPIDPATRARFMREKRCFEPDHDRKIEDLTCGIEDKIKLVATLEEALSNLKAEMMGMVKNETADEMVASAKIIAHREGETEAEARLRKEKRCFDGFHKFMEDKTMMNLGLVQILNLFIDLAKRPMSQGIQDKITVMVPAGYEPHGSRSRLELDKAIDSAIEAVFKKRPFFQ